MNDMQHRHFEDFGFCAFFSHAHGDDDAWGQWITKFATELDRTLPGRLRRSIKALPVHLSSLNGPMKGQLSRELIANVDRSFVMVLFVHDGYLESDWCLRELEYFKTLFGDDGFRERLFVIAMSKPAVEALVTGSDWQRVCPFPDQMWLPFFDPGKPSRPMAIHGSDMYTKEVLIAPEFWTKFVDVRENLVSMIYDHVERERFFPTFPSNTPAAREVQQPEDEGLVRVYIEGDKEHQRYWDPLGQHVLTSWSQVIAGMTLVPNLYLRPTGLPMEQLAQRPWLDDADGVVLLWDDKHPDSLAAQISMVEPKLSGPNFAPGLVAYIMADAGDTGVAESIGNWRVLRFAPQPDGGVKVLPEDAPLLNTFLVSVLEHKRQRNLAAKASIAAAGVTV